VDKNHDRVMFYTIMPGKKKRQCLERPEPAAVVDTQHLLSSEDDGDDDDTSTLSEETAGVRGGAESRFRHRSGTATPRERHGSGRYEPNVLVANDVEGMSSTDVQPAPDESEPMEQTTTGVEEGLLGEPDVAQAGGSSIQTAGAVDDGNAGSSTKEAEQAITLVITEGAQQERPQSGSCSRAEVPSMEGLPMDLSPRRAPRSASEQSHSRVADATTPPRMVGVISPTATTSGVPGSPRISGLPPITVEGTGVVVVGGI
jgi:hypothetical protein